jgi:tetratricopeptide (TPR) repeat protein
MCKLSFHRVNTSFAFVAGREHCAKATHRVTGKRETFDMQSAAPVIEPLPLSTADAEVQAALAVAEDPSAAPEERAEMLMEIARGLQIKPRSARQLHDAVTLYRRARSLVPPGFALLAARIRAREGTAHQALPDGGVQALLDAQDCYEQARADLAAHGLPEETAELDMNLGLVSQTLVGAHRGRIQDAIAHYHRALRVFTKEAWPREFSILHNNLAIAYLSIPATDERARMREALAVQSFEEVLQLLTLVDHPSEYAMTQNNLGNALQYAPSSHPVANLLRAIEAYDEALKVRNARDMPVEYANTVANKANALLNLPDDPQHPALGNAGNTAKARALYREAMTLFERHGLTDAAAAVAEGLGGIGNANADFGASRVPGAATH